MSILSYLNSNIILVAIATAILVVLIWKLNFIKPRYMLIIYVLGILYLTIINRVGVLTGIDTPFTYTFMHFFNKAFFIGFLENTMLFIPIGAILYRILPKWRVVWVGVGLTYAIELVQLFTTIGACEFTDLLANSLGTVMGFGIMSLLKKYQIKTEVNSL